MALGQGQLSTTATSLYILDLIADRKEMTLRGLVEETGLAKSTVYKHLSTLRTNGYLVKNGEWYRLSLRHLALGKQAVDQRESYRLVDQKTRELGSQTDAEVDFTVEEDGRLILVSETIGRTNESTFGMGSEFCLHNTAAGKAILAEYSETRLHEILDERGMPKTTEKTIQSREVLKSELETVRDRGYALNDGECVEGYRTVSSVIVNPDGSILGAISAGGPVYRIERSRLVNDLSRKVREVTDIISKKLADASSTP